MSSLSLDGGGRECCEGQRLLCRQHVQEGSESYIIFGTGSFSCGETTHLMYILVHWTEHCTVPCNVFMSLCLACFLHLYSDYKEHLFMDTNLKQLSNNNGK